MGVGGLGCWFKWSLNLSTSSCFRPVVLRFLSANMDLMISTLMSFSVTDRPESREVSFWVAEGRVVGSFSVLVLLVVVSA